MEDGDTGEFTTFLIWDEVTVKWTWYAGEDWDANGYFDIFVYQDNVNITYDIPKMHFKWLEEEVKEFAGYEPPSRQHIARSINAHFNKSF